MEKHVKADPAQARAFEILNSIPGISVITAIAVLSELPEIGSLDSKAAASLAGLAPVTRQSGTWQGHSFVQGGRCQRHGEMSRFRQDKMSHFLHV